MRRRLTAVVGGLVVLSAALAHPGPVGAEGTYEAVAGADGVRVSLRVPDAPVTDVPVDGGGPTALAVLDSSGVSRAFASHPYPGEAVVTGPGTVAGASGGQVNLPGYPLFVSSDHPTVPEQVNEQGPYRLEATSGERRSEAEARAGAETGPLVTSVARVEAGEEGGATAEAVAVVEAFAAGDLHLGRVRSSARVTQAPDGSLTRASSLEVTGFSVAGTQVAIGPRGLSLPGATVPLPPTDPVRQALAGAGITVTYLAAQEQPSGVVAPGLSINAPLALPSGPTVTVTYTLGRTSAAVGGQVSAGESLETLASTSPAVEAPASDAGNVPSLTSDAGSASGPTSSGGFEPVAPAPGFGAAGPTSAGVEAAPVGSPTPLAAPLVVSGDFDMSSFFAFLVAGALAALALVTLFTVFGVRWRWTS
jgi:hypothetical protein